MKQRRAARRDTQQVGLCRCSPPTPTLPDGRGGMHAVFDAGENHSAPNLKKKYKGLAAAAAAVHEGNPEEKDQKKKPARKPPD